MAGNTQTHADAIGFLDDLVAEINFPWFKLLRDVAVLNNTSVLEPSILEKVCEVLLGETDEVPLVASAAQSSFSSPSATSTDYLEKLSTFSNFKLLSDTLQVDFKKQITLIFGTNGSGKSSLCESFKVLANPNKPNRPIKNLRTTSSMPSSFAYKLRSNAAAEIWTPSSGYGVHSDRIKYFDSAVASRNVTVAVEPGRVITLTPFKLGVFETVKTLTSQIRDTLRTRQESNTTLLKQSLAELNTEFREYSDSPIKSIIVDTMGVLSGEISKAETYSQQKELADLLASADSLEKATSDIGLKALKLEHHELESITSELRIIADSAEELWGVNPVEKAKIRDSKKTEQKTLADVLIPKGASLEKLLALLKSTAALCALDKATGQICPLCRRKLEEGQIELFKQYHELVAGQLEADITDLNTEIKRATDLVEKVNAIDVNAWGKLETLSSEMISTAKSTSTQIVSACSLTSEPSIEARGSITIIRELIRINTEQLASKAQVIEISTKGRDAVLLQLASLKSQIKPLAYLDFLSKKLDKLRKAQQMIDKSRALDNALLVFTPLFTKITNASKIAHENLVVCDFEERLNLEYKNLTEKDMGAFGVTLKRIGSDASVTVKPQVGGNGIDEVLSEGELRMHSLALFFAELECSCCPVLVFDDPASSFDYNYITNYCVRLRNFALTHQACQIIILTHNWEFFVQLQTTFNKSTLCNNFSVQVLESCTYVSEYSENIDTLKRDISSVLAAPNEPSKQQKEDMAGKMRRLIESIINTHIFSGQRTQYKQRGQNVSEFRSYTKVTPLIPTEATELSDLYSILSPAEHDDPRNAFVNTDKAAFQTRFNRINSIEAAIITRKQI